MKHIKYDFKNEKIVHLVFDREEFNTDEKLKELKDYFINKEGVEIMRGHFILKFENDLPSFVDKIKSDLLNLGITTLKSKSVIFQDGGEGCIVADDSVRDWFKNENINFSELRFNETEK